MVSMHSQSCHSCRSEYERCSLCVKPVSTFCWPAESFVYSHWVHAAHGMQHMACSTWHAFWCYLHPQPYWHACITIWTWWQLVLQSILLLCCFYAALLSAWCTVHCRVGSCNAVGFLLYYDVRDCTLRTEILAPSAVQSWNDSINCTFCAATLTRVLFRCYILELQYLYICILQCYLSTTVFGFCACYVSRVSAIWTLV